MCVQRGDSVIVGMPCFSSLALGFCGVRNQEGCLPAMEIVTWIYENTVVEKIRCRKKRWREIGGLKTLEPWEAYNRI